MLIRYWYTSINLVPTRYYNSEFLGKASADDGHTKFEICPSSLKSNKMSQVYFDNSNSVDLSNAASYFF